MGRKRKRTEHVGSVAWSDVELDAVLGDYTDMELSRGSSGSDSDSSLPQPASPKKQLGPVASKYTCTECGAVLKTITGFRGHMTRKHKRSDVRGMLTDFHMLSLLTSQLHKSRKKYSLL